MTDQASAPAPESRVPWPMIIGVAVLGVFALILLALVLTRGTDGTGSTSASPSPSSTASPPASGSPSTSATPTTAAATASADAPAQPDLPVDTVVATTVEGLTVRAAPGIDGERLGTLEAGALSFLAGGPTDADGYRWYLVSGLGLPPNTGCAGDLETDPFNCPIWFGWAAAASESGEPWLVEHDLSCPEDPYTAENLAIGRTSLELLACFGAEPISFRGFWPELTDGPDSGAACTAEDAPTGWLICQQLNDKIIVVDENEDAAGVGIRVSIDPATDVTMPERGTWVEALVHFDDPAAQQCDDDATGAQAEERTPEQLVLACRAEAVLEAAQAVDGP
jgi:hypothetical protein